MDIPEYKLRKWLSRYMRLSKRATCDKSDTLTADLLRLARRDAREIERIMAKQDGKPVCR